MTTMLAFGAIFSYKEKLYVYLGMDEDTVYAALILNAHEAQDVIKARGASLKTRGERDTRHFPIFCFVELTTEGYQNHIAHMGKTQTQKEPDRFLQKNNEHICKSDMVAIRDTIVEGPLPPVLKSIVAKIDFDSLPN